MSPGSNKYKIVLLTKLVKLTKTVYLFYIYPRHRKRTADIKGRQYERRSQGFSGE